MSNIIDSIQLSGVTYTIQGSGGGGNPTVELTQAEYDALVTAGTVSPNTYYIITDAQAGDLTNYYTKTETNTLLGGKADTATTYTKTEVDNAITAATSTKQDTLVSGTNIKTINNESLLGSGNITIQGGGGGGKAVSGGTNISITTGETADTINCTLPITASNNNRCIITGTEGVKGSAEGMGTYESFITGRENKATNYAEAAFGRYNRSNHKSDTFGDSGNTLFSVGNGTGILSLGRHNAFEIRQNGDIYITSGGTDILLQDHLGGGGGKAIEAGRGISITTGETADTVSLDVPIYKVENGTGNTCVGTTNNIGLGSYNCFLIGENNSTTFYQSNSILCGNNNYINEIRCSSSQCFGSYNKINNAREFASGCYNNSIQSNSTFGDSGNTLFSVGNGTADNARHNAFEIRQNGDIYLTLDGQDVKLQDQLGGGSITVDTSLDSGSTNPVENRVIYNKIDEVEQVTAAALNNINDRLSEDEEVTAAGLNAVNDKFDGLKLKKLTQSQYDALSGNTDSNTLYVIVN